MNYTRVIPRDFFNESKLLCCLGKLSLHISDRETGNLKLIEEFDNEPFQIDLSDNGELYVLNYSVFLNKDQIELYIPINSRDKYPLKGIWRDKEYQMLDEEGNFLFKKVGEIG